MYCPSRRGTNKTARGTYWVTTMSDTEEYWLVKVPNYILSEWEKRDVCDKCQKPWGQGHLKSSCDNKHGGKNPNAGDTLGHITVDSRGPKPKMTLSTHHVDDAFPQGAAIEDRPVPSTQQLVYVDKGKQPPQAQCGGRLKRVLQVQPQIDQKYNQLLLKRNMKYHTPDRAAISISASEARGLMVTAMEAETVKRQKLDKEQHKYKNVRMERPKLEQFLYRLFDPKLKEGRTHWSLKDLKLTTKQPQEWLKEVLNSLCDYHKQGEHIFTYSLKA